jgi:serine/threonine protein kinase
MVIEYIVGGEFFTHLRKAGRFEHTAAKFYASQIIQVFEYMHQSDYIYRDLKPENILMVDNSENAEVKIVDFGLSKTFGPGETCNEPYGTLCYVAPEILMQLPYDKAVDCWSFGIIIYLMLGRHLPFDS